MNGMPLSSVSVSAIRSPSASIKSASFSISRARCAGGGAAHPSKAARAAFTARSISAAPPLAALAKGRPVAGSTTPNVSPLTASTKSPPMKCVRALPARSAFNVSSASGEKGAFMVSAFGSSGADLGELPVLADRVEDVALDEDRIPLLHRTRDEIGPVLKRVKFGADDAGEPFLVEHDLVDLERLANLREHAGIESAYPLLAPDHCFLAEMEDDVLIVKRSEGV